MDKSKGYHGTVSVCYNHITGEYRLSSVKPAGKGWSKPCIMSKENWDYISN